MRVLFLTLWLNQIFARPQDDEYLGCYDSAQIPDNRVYKHNVPLNMDGVIECRTGCAELGYVYYGFECPMAGGQQVHCECQREIPEDWLLRTDCARAANHCNGASEVEGMKMGTAWRMTLYQNRDIEVEEEAPFPNVVPEDEFLGCYDSRNIRDNRLYKNAVSISVKGIWDCKKGCGEMGYAIYGFECPMANNGLRVHCECRSGVPDQDLIKTDCAQEINHCNGPSEIDGVQLGTAHRMTLYRDPDLSPTPADVPEDEYLGCFDSSRVSDNRVHKYLVSLDVGGIWDCRQGCANEGYVYYGFECPMMEGSEVHCECYNSIPNASLGKDDCEQTVNHCNGDKDIDGVKMGTAWRFQLYHNPELKGEEIREAPNDEYLGCYDSQQIPDNRTYKYTVTLDVAGIWDCKEGCALLGYDYYGFECPMVDGAKVHCECQESIPDSSLLKDDCNRSQNHCNAVGEIAGVQMGTAWRMTLYRAVPEETQEELPWESDVERLCEGEIEEDVFFKGKKSSAKTESLCACEDLCASDDSTWALSFKGNNKNPAKGKCFCFTKYKAKIKRKNKKGYKSLLFPRE